MPLSEADEYRLSASIKVEKTVKAVGAKNVWKAVSGSDKLTLLNPAIGLTVEIARAVVDEFGLEEVLATVEALRLKSLIEEIELNNSILI